MKKPRKIQIPYRLAMIFILVFLLVKCGSTKETLAISNDEKKTFEQIKSDTISISSDKIEYEIIIIEPGFNTWLSSIAKPEGYYSQRFLENRNYLMVVEWNRRVLSPTQYSPNLYDLQIDYSQNIDYGYEVNYKLYNYFIFFQRKHNQRLGPFLPRI